MAVRSPDDRRLYPRRSVRVAAQFHSGACREDCTVTDLSASGAKVKCKGEQLPGSIGTLEIDNFVRTVGRVVRQDPEGFGFRFLDDREAYHG